MRKTTKKAMKIAVHLVFNAHRFVSLPSSIIILYHILIIFCIKNINFLKYVAISPLSLYNIYVQKREKEQKMIKYIKENLDSIFKLFINHMGMMIFSLVVLLTAKLLSTKMNNSIVFYIMGVVTVLMYFSLIYTAMWEKGAQDKIKIDGGRLNKNIFNGLYFYLIANFIAIFSGIIALIFSFLVTEDASFVNDIYGAFRIISHYYSGMYMWITQIDFASPVVHSLIYIAVIIPGALVAFVSYILGVKGCKCIFPEPKRDKNRRVR